MRGKHRKKRKGPVGTGAGKGHGGNTPILPEIKERPLSRAELMMRQSGMIEKNIKGYRMGRCRITVGSSHLGWHMSISHPRRYPTWDELAKARYKLIPDYVTMVQVLPSRSEFVNVHNYCFHLWQAQKVKDNEMLHVAISE